jgi:Tol biopolymer transport system component
MHLSKANSSKLFVIVAILLVSLPAHATFPGQNGKIVFNANGTGTWQMYIINPDGTGMTQITNLPPTSIEGWFPTFSPDGKKIAFFHDMSGAPEIYTINADGSGLTRLTFDNLFDASPRWSPDGTQIAFARADPLTLQTVIATMPASGGPITNLTNKFWSAFLPTYTPDGTRITSVSSQGGFISVVRIMDRDGSHQGQLTRPDLNGLPADISPDGKHILVINNESTPVTPYEVFRMNLDGSDLVRLSDPGKGNYDIPGTYSPDGTKIVFVSNRRSKDVSLDLFIMNADGSDIHRIASGLTVGGCPDTNCVTPSWGPQAKQ